MLKVKNLSVGFHNGRTNFYVVKSLSFSMREGEILAVVGESGSGKTMTALAIMGLLPGGAWVRGAVWLQGRLLTVGRQEAWSGWRGKSMAMVFQNPSASLNPVVKVGWQVSEMLQVHRQMNKESAVQVTWRLFSSLGLVPPKRRFHQYPHQLSGGLQQRVMLAIALSCSPLLLIADEPTSALDLTVQAQILELLQANVRGQEKSLLLVTHDLGVVAQAADRVLVMCGGVMVEEATVTELFGRPQHPYTKMLLDSVPRLDGSGSLGTRGAFFQDRFRPAGGCPFLPRCRQGGALCRQMPPLFFFSPTHSVCCHRAGGGRHV